MAPDRWEVGSDLHELAVPWQRGGSAPWGPHWAYYGTGRDVVIALTEPNTRLWVPSYFCQEVIGRWLAEGLDVRCYPDSPLREAERVTVDASKGDVVVTVAYFGIRSAPVVDIPGVLVLEDHSHDPLSSEARRSRAEVCFASLRKTLPVPDGAVAWSRNRELPVPPEIDPTRAAAILDRLTAMCLKTRYLEGQRVEKEVFRACAIRGEERLGQTGPTAASPYSRELLHSFSFERWREARRANWTVLASLLREGGVEVLGESTEGRVPFSVVVRFETRAERDAVQARLIDERIYPAVLWNLDAPVLDGVPAEDRELAGQLLSVHCDGRYGEDDMNRVAARLLHARPGAA